MNAASPRQQAAEPGPGAVGSGMIRASWLSAALLLGPLSFLGEILITRTHHRPLGAATFACVAVVLWGLAEILTKRLLDADVCVRRARARRLVQVISVVLSASVLVRVFF